MYVVMIDNNITKPKTMLKRGLIDFEISAKGISNSEIAGLFIKHNIPTKINKHIMLETYTPTFVLLTLFLPASTMAKDAKNIFCEA